jgi:hypothetical protein
VNPFFLYEEGDCIDSILQNSCYECPVLEFDKDKPLNLLQCALHIYSHSRRRALYRLLAISAAVEETLVLLLKLSASVLERLEYSFV